MRYEHKRDMRLFRETVDIKKDKKIVQAVNPQYLNSLQNQLTNTIINNVPAVLAHLLIPYGIVESRALADKEKTFVKCTTIFKPLWSQFITRLKTLRN